MYCPKCGQAQASEDIRFCSRCGLALSGLAAWIAAGQISASGQHAPAVKTTSRRRRAIRRGAKLTFISVVLSLFMFVLALATNAPELLFVPLTTLLVGVAWMLYARLFIDDGDFAPKFELPGVKESARTLNYGAIPAAIGDESLGTGEMVRPPSVTEHTTNLLRQK